MREAVSDEPSTLELVQTCLTERSAPSEVVVADLIALSAARGALRATVEGNWVTVALGGSEKDAERLYENYVSVTSAAVANTLLDRRGNVVFLWEHEPTSSQREFMYLCTRDAQR